MDDKDFDNIFGDKLKEQKDFPLSEEKWAVLEKQYDHLLAEKRYRRLLLFGSLPLLALLGSLLWTLLSLNNTNKKLNDLMNEIHFLQQQKTGSVTPSVNSGLNTSDVAAIPKSDISIPTSDTVYHKIVVYRYDTIYQTVVRREIIESNAKGFDSKTSQLTIENTGKEQGYKAENAKTSIVVNPENAIIFDKNGQPINQKEVKEIQQTNIQQAQLPLKNTDKTKIVNPLNPLDTANHLAAAKPISEHIKTSDNKQNDTINLAKTTPPIKQADSLSEKVVIEKAMPPLSINADTAAKTFEKALEKQEAKKRPIINPIKIEGYELGIVGGTAFINNSNILRQTGYNFGLRGGILLGRRLQVIGEAQRLNTSFEVERLDPRLDIPTITPPTPDDEFHGVTVSQPYWQFALGLKYHFNNSKRWQPYVSASIVGQSKLEEAFNYEFTNRVTKENTFVTYRRNDAVFETGILRTGIGVQYRVFGKFHSILEGGYDFKLKSTPQYKPIWQVKLGLLYHF